MKKKAWWKSKTLWMNIAAIATMAASQGAIPAEYAPYVLGGANILMRIFGTKSAVGLKDE